MSGIILSDIDVMYVIYAVAHLDRSSSCKEILKCPFSFLELKH